MRAEEPFEMRDIPFIVTTSITYRIFFLSASFLQLAAGQVLRHIPSELIGESLPIPYRHLGKTAGPKFCGNEFGSFDRLVTGESPGRINLVMISATTVWILYEILESLELRRTCPLTGQRTTSDPSRPKSGPKVTNKSRFGFCLPIVQAEKRAQRLTFWVRRPPGGVGVFHAKGWWPKSSCSPSKVCLPWVSKRGIWDVPGILVGCPGRLGVFKKFVQKKFVRIFRSLIVRHFQDECKLGVSRGPVSSQV